ncbi:MAG: hypothetical protein GWO04_48795, partial [Actinobacteria bacterium]|nr:hypothetical protein [Actinomycetota bacterium]
ETNDVFEVFIVAGTGGTPFKLNSQMPEGGDVIDIGLPGAGRVVFLADQEADEQFDLFVASVATGHAERLNPALIDGGDVLGFIPSDPLIYLADQRVDDVFEAFRVDLDGGLPVPLNAPLVEGGDVTGATLGASGILLYLADQEVDEQFELYAVRVEDAAPAVKLNAEMPEEGDVIAFAVSADGSRVVYAADQDTDNIIELYSVSLDADVDGRLDALDCLPTEAEAWALPGEVVVLTLEHTGPEETTLRWSPPPEPGGTVVAYDVLRSPRAADFVKGTTCLAWKEGSALELVDETAPAPHGALFYLVRPRNGCGSGPAGHDSDGQPTPARHCSAV